MALFSKRDAASGETVEEVTTEKIFDMSSLDAALLAGFENGMITEAEAMGIPAVAAAVGFISRVIAGLPVKMYRTKDGKSEEITDDYRLRLLNQETWDLLDANQMKAALVKDYLLCGNGYVYVNRNGLHIQSLHYVEPINVSYDEPTDPIFKATTFHINGSQYMDYELMRILRNSKNGINGRGLVDENQVLLKTMLSSLKYERNMVLTGGMKGFLRSKGRLKQEALNGLRRNLRKMFSMDNPDNVAVLNEGLEFQNVGQTAVESQLNQNKLINSKEMLELFGIVPGVLTGNATENDVKNTIEFGIKPVVKAMETAFNRFLLLESEKDSLEFCIDMDELDMTNILTRYQAYEVAIRNGWMQLDEVRYEEGRNPLGLKFIRLGLDTVIYDPVKKEIYTPNTKEWVKFDQKNTAKIGGDDDESGDQSGQEPDDH